MAEEKRAGGWADMRSLARCSSDEKGERPISKIEMVESSEDWVFGDVDRDMVESLRGSL